MSKDGKCTFDKVDEMHKALVADSFTVEAAEALLKVDQARKTKACGSPNKVTSKFCTQASDWVTSD